MAKTAKIDLGNIDREKLLEVVKQRKHMIISVNDICPNPYNKNRMGGQYFMALKANLADPRVGFTIPILVRPNPNSDATARYMIVDGEHRWKGAREVGYSEIPCIVMPQMPEELAKYLMVESNAVHGTTDDADVKQILSTVESSEFLKGLDVWATTVTEAPIADQEKYAVGDEDLDNIGNDATVPVTLYLKRPEQIDKFRVLVGQIRLTSGCTQEDAVMQIVDFYMEATGFGEKTGDEATDAKQADLVARMPKKGKRAKQSEEQMPPIED